MHICSIDIHLFSVSAVVRYNWIRKENVFEYLQHFELQSLNFTLGSVFSA